MFQNDSLKKGNSFGSRHRNSAGAVEEENRSLNDTDSKKREGNLNRSFHALKSLLDHVAQSKTTEDQCSSKMLAKI